MNTDTAPNCDQQAQIFGTDSHEYHDCQQALSAANSVMDGLMAIVGAIVAWLVFTIVAMCLYKSKVHDKKPPIVDGNKTMESGKFHFGLFECFSNCNECLCSFCCTGLRFADTHASVTTTGFWLSFVMFFIVNSLLSTLSNTIAVAVHPVQALSIESTAVEVSTAASDLTTQYYIFLAVSALCRGCFFGLYSRGEIRKKLGSPETDAMSKVVDVLSWGCCFPCAMTQEAVEVDIAADVHIACPWTLTIGRASALGVKAREVAPAEYEAMVGDAVLLDGR